MTKQQPPTREDLHWPTLKALELLGGSASIYELSEQIAIDLALSDEILDIPHKDGLQSEVDYRAAWARTDLKHIGAVDNTSRGVWTITESGRKIQTEREVRKLIRSKHATWAKARQAQNTGVESANKENNDQEWQEELLGIIRNIQPGAFERLCQRVLRESGFAKVEVTGRSGDGGIDGVGVLQVELISFHVCFQCKRYTGSVSSREIRDFRGALSGRAEKGLFITTGRFTRDAEHEAVRDGAPAIDLIDGTHLCILLRDLRLGVETQEVVKPQLEFFEAL